MHGETSGERVRERARRSLSERLHRGLGHAGGAMRSCGRGADAGGEMRVCCSEGRGRRGQ
ncbi:Hypothetical protein CAP_1977 [Chondromyces apiculatus DSM 436]|uniref:Uncharacterized protein n=1 Tax=Chondromyces apiculatus DSM 436 TaxID=1192034 RepID=A0A017TC11_9BACT|nr:Hypothetical protein CAP_1977 [Chondromyces apiculatus DSM 436]